MGSVAESLAGRRSSRFRRELCEHMFLWPTIHSSSRCPISTHMKIWWANGGGVSLPATVERQPPPGSPSHRTGMPSERLKTLGASPPELVSAAPLHTVSTTRSPRSSSENR